MKKYSTNTSIMTIMSSKLHTDDYQRPLDQNRVGSIAKNFDPNLVNLIKCSMRSNGNIFIFDGQHTKAALEVLNGNKPVMVECRVYEFVGLSDKERHDVEAVLFAQQNGISRAVHLGNRLKAEYLSGDPNVIAFYNASNSVGLEMDFTTRAAFGKIGCIGEAYRAWKSLDGFLYSEMLKTIVKIWDKDPQSLRREIIGGMAHFMRKYRGVYDNERLIDCLSAVAPLQIIRDGDLHSNSGTGKYGEQIVKLYNKGLSRKMKLV